MHSTPAETRSFDDLLVALHQSLGHVLREPTGGADFFRLVRTLRSLREIRFPRGKPQVQQMSVDGRWNFRIDVGDRLGADLYFGCYRETLDLHAFCESLEAGDTLIDVGANFGFVTVCAADRVGPTGRVIAFEPDERAYALLADNVSLNSCGRQVELVRRCVSNENTIVRFHTMEESAFSGLADTGRSTARAIVNTRAQRLDDAAHEFEFNEISALKIDVEGFEYAVLEGASEVLARSADALVMFEVSPKNLNDERRTHFARIVQTYLDTGWRAWSYDVVRNELVDFATAGDLLQSDGGNIFLAREHSARLERLRRAYSEILATHVLPREPDPVFGSNGAGASPAPHSLRQMLWNSFVNEFALGLRTERDGARHEVVDLRAQLAQVRDELAAERVNATGRERAIRAESGVRAEEERRARQALERQHLELREESERRAQAQATAELQAREFQELAARTEVEVQQQRAHIRVLAEQGDNLRAFIDRHVQKLQAERNAFAVVQAEATQTSKNAAAHHQAEMARATSQFKALRHEHEALKVRHRHVCRAYEATWGRRLMRLLGLQRFDGDRPPVMGSPKRSGAVR